MSMTNVTKTPENSPNLTEGTNCPECREKMKEVERCKENGVFFIWYACTRPDCAGKWLDRSDRGFNKTMP